MNTIIIQNNIPPNKNYRRDHRRCEHFPVDSFSISFIEDGQQHIMVLGPGGFVEFLPDTNPSPVVFSPAADSNDEISSVTINQISPVFANLSVGCGVSNGECVENPSLELSPGTYSVTRVTQDRDGFGGFGIPNFYGPVAPIPTFAYRDPYFFASSFPQTQELPYRNMEVCSRQDLQSLASNLIAIGTRGYSSSDVNQMIENMRQFQDTMDRQGCEGFVTQPIEIAGNTTTIFELAVQFGIPEIVSFLGCITYIDTGLVNKAINYVERKLSQSNMIDSSSLSYRKVKDILLQIRSGPYCDPAYLEIDPDESGFER